MDFDVVIVGGGLAGLALAVAMRTARLRVALVESQPVPARHDGWDARVYAISPANVRFLEQIGVWRRLDAARMAPIAAMEIHGDRGGRLDFSAGAVGVPALAWIVESSLMQRELLASAKRQSNLELLCPARPARLSFAADRATLHLQDGRTLAAKLVVAADGADSWTRRAAGIEVAFHPYRQHGVVANFACERPPAGMACQWFRDGGTLAYLPLPGKLMSMVWATSPEHAAQLLALDAAGLCARVAEAGRHRFGSLAPLTPPAAFPLRLMRAPGVVAPHLALIGDAAHTIHPLSGHGINLGFQDARVLAEVLAACPGHVHCGDVRWLRRYERLRREEVVALQSVTDGLQKLFAHRGQPVSLLRNFGLTLTNHLPFVRNALARYAMG
ncbi:MAG TPA: UbiH/UbiF family hydroxylase [Rhodocyclaceae bacterium]